MQRVLRILPCAKYIRRSQVNLLLVSFCPQPFGIRRFFCAQTFEEDIPASSKGRWKHSISVFLQRVLDSYKLINLLNEKLWNEDTPSALQSSNATLTPYVLSQVVKSCVDLDTALEFYKWSRTVDNGECVDSHVYVALMHRLGVAGRLEEVEAIASECESKGMATVATFTVQLAAYTRANDLDGALRTWKRMVKFGIKPNLASFTTMINIFATLKMYDEAADLYLLSLWEKLHPDVRMLTTIIHHLALAGKMDSAMAIFKDMRVRKARPNASTYATLMKGYANLGDIPAVINLVSEFKGRGFRPHRDTFTIFFEDMVGNEKKEDALNVMRELWPELSSQDLKGLLLYYQTASKKDGFDEDGDVDCVSEVSDMSDDEDESIEGSTTNPTSLWNFTGFVRCLCPWSAATAAVLADAKIKWDSHLVFEIMKRFKRVDAGWKFFNWVEGQEGFTHDKFTYGAMIRLLLTEGKFALVKQLMVEAQSKQLSLSLYTYNRVLKVSGMRKEAGVALDVFGLLESAGVKPDSLTYHNLIFALHKGGRYWRAATVFAEMEKAGFVPTATTYSYVVSGFAEAGHMKYAKAYYSRLRAHGLEPPRHLFSAFISGFYRIGRLDRAEQIFQQMRKNGMEPSPYAYELMIKVFRRAGKKAQLHQVESEIESLLPSKWVTNLQIFDKYLKFHQIFKESLAECNNDVQLYATD